MEREYQNGKLRERNARITTINDYMRDRFGCKVVKLALDGGFTCPNRDGSKGTGGCVFCSEMGSGDMAASACSAADIKAAMQSQVDLLSDKWQDAAYMAYFQSHTNTYAPVDELREKFEAALSCELFGATEQSGSEGNQMEPENRSRNCKVVGLAIATRPDCLSKEVLDYLSELNNRTFLWVELGLQTIHEKSADRINRCYSLDVYDEAVRELAARGIRTVTHLIFGLPGESKEDMLESVRYVCRPIHANWSGMGEQGDAAEIGNADDGGGSQRIFGIKMHLLNVIKGSRLAAELPDYVPFESMSEYIDLVTEALRLIPSDITIHRMTGDCPRKLLIAPEWSYKKRSILNGITARMTALNAHQGDKT